MEDRRITYVLDIDDPLRMEINSYWIGAHFGTSVLGSPTKLIPSYSNPIMTDSPTSLYQKRQRIKIIKDASFGVSARSNSETGIATTNPEMGTSVYSDPIGQKQKQPGSSGYNQSLGAPISKKLPGLPAADPQSDFPGYVEANFVDYFKNHTSDFPIQDIVYDVIPPIVVKDFSTTTNPLRGSNEVKEEFLINFLEKSYEDATSAPSISELSLPNFYKIITTNGPPPDSFLDEYASNISPSSADKSYENIIISMDNYEDLEALNGYDKVFPLEIKLSPNNSVISGMTVFYDALNKSNLDATLIDLASRQSFDTSAKESKFFQKTQIRDDHEEHIDPTHVHEDDHEDVTTTISLETLNLLDWSRDLTTILEGLTTEFATDNKIYLGSETLSINIAKGNTSALQQILSSAIFLGKIKDITRDNLRSFEELNTGQKSYSEIVFYKVEKYTSPDAPTPIQNIWIPNINQVDPVEYVDTQVKYNKQYFYRVFAYSAVVGTRYFYDMSTLETTFPIAAADEPCVILADTAGPSVPEHIHKIENWKIVGNYIVGNGDDKINRHPHPDLDPIILAGGYDWVKGFTETVEGFGSFDFDTDVLFDGGKTGDHHHKFKVDSSGNGVTLCGEPTTETKITPVDPSQEYFEIDVITEPTIDLIKTHLFDFDGSILDDPPMIPDINFITYVGVDNKVTINMHSQIGEYTNSPVILNSEDFDFIESLQNSRGMSIDSLVTYKTDDETVAFEIYRMEKAPISYEDFSNNLKSAVSTLQSDSSRAIYSWDSSYEDTIVPNTEYYYMVRSVDIHNHKSYPSPVYKVMIINDSGAIYPLVEIIEMRPPEKPKQNSIEFKKFLQIVPSLPQIQIDYEASGLISETGLLVNSVAKHKPDIVLGTESPRLFGDSETGQTFKIRLISRHTGKKLDLNVTFKVENEL